MCNMVQQASGTILVSSFPHYHTFFYFDRILCVCFLNLFSQIQGRILPVETICLQSSSFATGADVSWSREVVRDTSISCVSVQEISAAALSFLIHKM